ncbi:unnamed protein product [Clavelina lepadiformis]|uniref:Succinate dehydrogenase assembly factor 3 n=1 Tax=Clavelina lepadiformis TaxID=159417 RepID=A0ABP0F7P5_CLALP
MSSVHGRNVRNLYKLILRLHGHLPIDLKIVGDQYVKSEFKLHKNCNPEVVPEFMQQWILYANTLQKQVHDTTQHDKRKDDKLGLNISVEQLDRFTSEQLVQLHELMKETTKPNPQFNIKEG